MSIGINISYNESSLNCAFPSQTTDILTAAKNRTTYVIRQRAEMYSEDKAGLI